MVAHAVGKTWILNANYYDATYIRNKIGFELAKSCGDEYVPDSRLAEIYVNDEYMSTVAKKFVMEDILQAMDFEYTSHYMWLDLKQGILSD